MSPPASKVRVAITKWGDRPHWTYDASRLGSDEHGDWLGLRAGTVFTRPGRSFPSPNDQVVLVPAPIDGVRPWWLATFQGKGGAPWPALGGASLGLYVDITTPAQWHGDTLHAVDLDLDVVRATGGPGALLAVDDEDEFAEHQVSLGYPPEVVTAARASCDEVLAAVGAGAAPFDGCHLPWFEVLARVVSSSAGP